MANVASPKTMRNARILVPVPSSRLPIWNSCDPALSSNVIGIFTHVKTGCIPMCHVYFVLLSSDTQKESSCSVFDCISHLGSRGLTQNSTAELTVPRDPKPGAPRHTLMCEYNSIIIFCTTVELYSELWLLQKPCSNFTHYEPSFALQGERGDRRCYHVEGRLAFAISVWHHDIIALHHHGRREASR